MNNLEAAVRKQAVHYLSDEVAAVAGLSLQLLPGGRVHPALTEAQVLALARRMGLR